MASMAQLVSPRVQHGEGWYLENKVDSCVVVPNRACMRTATREKESEAAFSLEMIVFVPVYRVMCIYFRVLLTRCMLSEQR